MKWLMVFLAFLSLTVVSSSISVTKVYAADDIFRECTNAQAKKTDVCKSVRGQQGTDNNPVLNIIKGAIEIVSLIGGAAAVIGIIVSSIRLIVSNGDANTISSARSGIVYSLIGVAVIVLAQFIVYYTLGNV